MQEDTHEKKEWQVPVLFNLSGIATTAAGVFAFTVETVHLTHYGASDYYPTLGYFADST